MFGWNLPTGSEDENVFLCFAPCALRRGYPRYCHEKLIFFSYKDIHPQHILTVMLYGLEHKFFLFPFGGTLPLCPLGGHMLHMNNFWSLPPKGDPHQVWLKSIHWLWRRRWKWIISRLAPNLQTFTPSRGPKGGILGLEMNKLYFFLYIKVCT